MQSATITTQPALDPVSLAEVKLFLRIDDTNSDDLLADLITSARQLAEEYTRRKFINTGVTLTLDRWPTYRSREWWDGTRDGHVRMLDGQSGFITLPFPPIASVTSITAFGVDNVGTVYDAANYRIDNAGRVYLNQGAIWPINLRGYNAISVLYVAGYGANAGSVPSAIRHAIKITVAAMYENRECFEMPPTAKAALSPYRVLEERHNDVP